MNVFHFLYTMDETGIIILAAGNSSRLGTPKQLLVYKGKTFIAHVIDEAAKADLCPIIIIIGAHAEKVRRTIINEDVLIIHNEEWEQG